MPTSNIDVRWYPQVGDRLRRMSEDATGNAWDDILESANRSAPYLTGALIRSSRVTEVEDGQYRIEYSVPYAARMHWSQRVTLRSGRSRWLWTEIQRSDIGRMIAARIRGF